MPSWQIETDNFDALVTDYPSLQTFEEKGTGKRCTPFTFQKQLIIVALDQDNYEPPARTIISVHADNFRHCAFSKIWFTTLPVFRFSQPGGA